MLTATNRKISSQAAANCDRFEALIIGATFSIYYGSRTHGYYMQDRYCKVGPDTVQSITDSRQWPFAGTSASGASVILVPDGARSIVPYDCRA
jgi:hypothetical protein